MKMLKKFSEAQEKGYNYMLFIELGYLTSKNDLSTFQVKAVTIEGYFETIKQNNTINKRRNQFILIPC